MESVVVQPPKGSIPSSGDLVVYFSSVADDLPPWGYNPGYRDRKLREFWPTEPILASAVYSTSARYAAFGWSLIGPDRMTNIVRNTLHNSEHGKGWLTMAMKVLIDLFTQDNGSFMEVVRTSDNPSAPTVMLNHLDSNRCIRTGRWDEPVIYYDDNGRGHLLKWYQVITLEECPSPIERMYNVQYCAVTRLLRAAQVIRDISIYEREKVSGQFTRAVHLVSGVQKQSIDDALKVAQSDAESQGLFRYMQPLIVSALDPTATVSKETIELASLPDGFDKESAMRWYINQLALAFGGEYQDFAPLPSGNLGTSQQSKMLHLKGRGKGPKLFMNMLENVFNFQGIMPRSVTFKFGDADINEDEQLAQVRLFRAQERSQRIASGEIDATIARQIAVDCGDLDPKYLEYFKEQDLTPDRILSGSKEFSPLNI